MKRLLLFVLVLSAFSFSAHAQTSVQDKAWLKAAHQVNLAEIQSGAMAQKKTHSSLVRSTGRTLESDHRKLDSKLVPLARRLKVQLPNSPTAQAQATMQELQGDSGKAFDKAWVRDEAKGHTKAIAKTRKEIADGSSVAVKGLARKTLPVLEKHLQMLHKDSSRMHGGH